MQPQNNCLEYVLNTAFIKCNYTSFTCFPHLIRTKRKEKNSKETFQSLLNTPLRKSHHPCWNKVDKWPLNRLYRLDVLSLDCIPFMKWCSVCRPLLCFTDTDMKEFFPPCLSFPRLSPVLASNRLEPNHIRAYPSAYLTTYYSSSASSAVPADALEIIKRCLW